MTERILPAVAVRAAIPRVGPDLPGRRPAPAITRRPLPGAAGPGAGAATPRAAARPAVHRNQALLTTPARAGMLLGASAAVYAVSLAGVSWLQASSDADLAAARQPYLDAVAQTRATNDTLAAAISDASARAQQLADAYNVTGDEIAAYQANLDSLASLVADVQGSAASLPTRVKLPKVTVRTTAVSSAPRTTTSTTASGH